MMNLPTASALIAKAKTAILETLAKRPTNDYMDHMQRAGYSDVDAIELWSYVLGCANEAPIDLEEALGGIARDAGI